MAYESYKQSVLGKSNLYRATYNVVRLNVVPLVTEEMLRASYANYCKATGAPLENFESEKENCLNGLIDVAVAKILAGPNATEMEITKVQHDLWAWHRYNEGWKYDEVKDKALKTNPCLKPFEELTNQERFWDVVQKESYDASVKDPIDPLIAGMRKTYDLGHEYKLAEGITITEANSGKVWVDVAGGSNVSAGVLDGLDCLVQVTRGGPVNLAEGALAGFHGTISITDDRSFDAGMFKDACGGNNDFSIRVTHNKNFPSFYQNPTEFLANYHVAANQAQSGGGQAAL